MGATKLERFLPKNQHTPRKLFNFEVLGNSALLRPTEQTLNTYLIKKTKTLTK